jgi:multiple sugar transport system ATP-binding protein
MIYVTHDQVEAMTLADRIVVLRSGEIEQVGTPLELYHHPRNRFVAGFIGSPKMNFLDATVSDWSNGAVVRVGDSRAISVPVDGAAKSGDAVVLGVRPEHVRIVDPTVAPLKGEVLVVERLGGETFLHIDLGGEEPFVVKADGAVSVRHGMTVGIDFPAETLHLFDPSGAAYQHRERNVLLQ